MESTGPFKNDIGVRWKPVKTFPMRPRARRVHCTRQGETFDRARVPWSTSDYCFRVARGGTKVPRERARAMTGSSQERMKGNIVAVMVVCLSSRYISWLVS